MLLHETIQIKVVPKYTHFTVDDDRIEQFYFVDRSRNMALYVEMNWQLFYTAGYVYDAILVNSIRTTEILGVYLVINSGK